MTSTTRRRRRARVQATLAASPDEMLQAAHDYHSQDDCDSLLEMSFTLIRKIHGAEESVEKLRKHFELLKDKCELVTEPAHHQAVITSFSNNGKVLAQVATHNGARTRVNIHPDVDPEDLRIGANAWITSEGNCLIDVEDTDGSWGEIASFECFLDDGRMLLKERDNKIAVDVAESLRGFEPKKGDQIGFNRNIEMAFELVESPVKIHLFDDNVSGSFDDLVGLDKPIALIRNLIDFRYLHPDIAAKYALPDRHGILLHGPAGCGKTHMARCVASHLRTIHPGRACRFMHVAASSIYDMWLGQSEQKIIELFNAARKAALDGTVVMFIDEVDAIARRRGTDHGSGAPDRILNTILEQMDGLNTLKNIIVIAATNRPDSLDESFTRAGRFDHKVEINRPNRAAATAIFRHYLDCGRPLALSCNDLGELVSTLSSKLFAPNGQYAEVAKVRLSDGRHLPVRARELLSGAMIKNVVNVAAQQAALRETQTGVEGICEDDLSLAMHDEITAAVSLLSPANVKSYVQSIPRDVQPIDVQVSPNAALSNRYVRSEG